MSIEAYYDLKAPIRALILKENYNFALIFPIDVRKEMKFELFVFRVARMHPIERVYVLPELESGETIDFTYFGETGLGTGDDIFVMSDEKPYRILHFGYGVYPPNVKVWKAQPSGWVVTGWSRKLPTKVGDPVDYVDGNISPFSEPTKISETVMWFKGSITFGVRNDESVKVKPKIRFIGSGYDTWLVTDKTLVEKIIKGIIPCRFISVGGLTEIQYTVPDEWKGKSFVIGQQDLIRLIGGGASV